jgi:hypothetical protein
MLTSLPAPAAAAPLVPPPIIVPASPPSVVMEPEEQQSSSSVPSPPLLQQPQPSTSAPQSTLVQQPQSNNNAPPPPHPLQQPRPHGVVRRNATPSYPNTELKQLIALREALKEIIKPVLGVAAADRTLITTRSDEGYEKVKAARDRAELKWKKTHQKLVRQFGYFIQVTQDVQAAIFEMSHYNNQLIDQKKRKSNHIAASNNHKRQAASERALNVAEPT